MGAENEAGDFEPNINSLAPRLWTRRTFASSFILESYNLAIVVLFLVLNFLDIVAAINVPKQAPNVQLFLSLGHEIDQTPNATILDETVRDTDFLPISSMTGSTPWHLPRLFTRQNCIGDQNKCFAGSDDTWCGCDAICCTNTVEKFGYCCTSVKVCDIPNSACMDPVYVN